MAQDMKWYIVSDRDLDSLKSACIGYDEIPFGISEVHKAMDSCKCLPIPDDLMAAIANEPWEYRSGWLKEVNRVASKLRSKGILIVNRLLNG